MRVSRPLPLLSYSIACLLAGVLLAGCGNKGDLVQPPPPPDAAAAPATR